MFSRLHNRLGTAGFVIAIIALVAAVAGTAFAATGLNSKQKKEVKKIAKSVVQQGPAGAAGAAGANGAAGAAGPEGSPWTAGGTLPSGKTETGIWSAAFTTDYGAAASISFSIPLAAPLDGQHVKKVGVGKTPPAECDNGSGEAPSAANPEADPGFLCVFVASFENGGSAGAVSDPLTGGSGAAKTGAVLFIGTTGGLEPSAPPDTGIGTFAVTAP
ncbi:MAG TPA: hypothetical protein VFX45_08270 [Solirubrobacterales bacterium]|nr:hypothetical protein [Solirubrobacterales bacterium]